jgi:DNA-binding NtrC family response regulator
MQPTDTHPAAGSELPAELLPAELLLVEDDTALRTMLSLEFEDLGYDVVAADSIASAGAAIAERRFGFALIDINLPDGRGSDLVGPLRGHTSDSGIILCSGAHGADRALTAQTRAAMLAFLPKPLDLNRIEVLLRRHADRRAARRRASKQWTGTTPALPQSSDSKRVPTSSLRAIGSNARSEGGSVSSTANAAPRSA